MEKSPNELQELVASHLSVKDLRSYRLVNRQFELIANRLFFDTVLFKFKANHGHITIRPAIAQHIKRLHIDMRDGPIASCDPAVKLDHLIKQTISAGARVKELCLNLEALPGPETSIERCMITLASHASFFSNMTHFSVGNMRGFGRKWPATSVVLKLLLKFLDSLENIEHVHLLMVFHKGVDKEELKRLWKIFLTHSDCCPKQMRNAGKINVYHRHCHCNKRRWGYNFISLLRGTYISGTDEHGPEWDSDEYQKPVSGGFDDDSDDYDPGVPDEHDSDEYDSDEWESDGESRQDALELNRDENEPELQKEGSSNGAEDDDQSRSDDKDDDSYLGDEEDGFLGCILKTLRRSLLL